MVYMIRVKEFLIKFHGLALHFVTLSKSIKMDKMLLFSFSWELTIVSKRKTEMYLVMLQKKLTVRT